MYYLLGIVASLLIPILPVEAAVTGLNGDEVVAVGYVERDRIVDPELSFRSESSVRGKGLWEWTKAVTEEDAYELPFWWLGDNCRVNCSKSSPDWYPRFPEAPDRYASYFLVVDTTTDWFEPWPRLDDGLAVYLFSNAGDPARMQYSGMSKGSGVYSAVTVDAVVPLPGGVVLLATGLGALALVRRARR